MPLSCAGHRGLNRSASIESVDGNPQGCYVNWQQNNQPVKGNDHYMHDKKVFALRYNKLLQNYFWLKRCFTLGLWLKLRTPFMHRFEKLIKF